MMATEQQPFSPTMNGLVRRRQRRSITERIFKLYNHANHAAAPAPVLNELQFEQQHSNGIAHRKSSSSSYYPNGKIGAASTVVGQNFRYPPALGAIIAGYDRLRGGVRASVPHEPPLAIGTAPTTRRNLSFSSTKARRLSPSPQLFRNFNHSFAYSANPDPNSGAYNDDDDVFVGDDRTKTQHWRRTTLGGGASNRGGLEKRIDANQSGAVKRNRTPTEQTQASDDLSPLKSPPLVTPDESSTCSSHSASSASSTCSCDEEQHQKRTTRSSPSPPQQLSPPAVGGAMPSEMLPPATKKRGSSIRLSFSRQKRASSKNELQKKKQSSPGFFAADSAKKATLPPPGTPRTPKHPPPPTVVRRVASCTFASPLPLLSPHIGGARRRDGARNEASATDASIVVGGQQCAKTSAKFTLGPIGKTVKKTILGLRAGGKRVDTVHGALTPPTKDEVRAWEHSFIQLLNHKYGCALFRQFVALEHSDENLEFWQRCELFKRFRCASGSENSDSSFSVEEETAVVRTEAQTIFDTYIANGAEKEVNLDSTTKSATRRALKQFGLFDSTESTSDECASDALISRDERSLSANKSSESAPPQTLVDANVFSQAQTKIEQLMEKDSYQRFLKSDMYLDLLNNKNTAGGGAPTKSASITNEHVAFHSAASFGALLSPTSAETFQLSLPAGVVVKVKRSGSVRSSCQ